jgi:hypothetical protein
MNSSIKHNNWFRLFCLPANVPTLLYGRDELGSTLLLGRPMLLVCIQSIDNVFKTTLPRSCELGRVGPCAAATLLYRIYYWTGWMTPF